MSQIITTKLSPREKQWLLAHGYPPNKIQNLLSKWQKQIDAPILLKCNHVQLVKLAISRINGKGFGMSGNLFGPVKDRKERVYVGNSTPIRS